jgi:hypothetical protein
VLAAVCPGSPRWLFAWCPEAGKRRLITGVNFSPGIANPFQALGTLGRSLDTILTNQRANGDEPVITLVHLACPRLSFTDRGKTAVALGGIDDPEDEQDKKIVPNAETLAEAYRAFVHGEHVKEAVERVLEEIEETDTSVPAGLKKQVAEHLRQHPAQRWDEAVAAIAKCLQAGAHDRTRR